VKITRKGYYTIEGPDGNLLLNDAGTTRQATTRDDCYEYITEDGRSGTFKIYSPDREVEVPDIRIIPPLSGSPDPTSPPPSGAKDMVIGLNAGFFNEWADTNYVANLVKIANIQTKPSNPVDAFDYPIGNIIGEFDMLVGNAYIRGGTYHVRWSGTTAPASVNLTPNNGSAVINANEKTFQVSEANPGTLTLNIGPGGTLLSSNGGLQCFHADDLARVNAGQFCTQQYVDAYQGINHWRAFWPSWGSSSSIIDFIDVNPQDRMNWVFTYAGANHDWTNPGDISLECIVGIANELGGNLYYPLPPKGTDACWQAIIDYIGANLTGTLYLTIGNEIWNTFAEFGDNTRWFEVGRSVPGYEVAISPTGLVTQPGHPLSNGDTINLFARQHETEPYVWGGIAAEVANDMFTVTNVTASTWQLADNNNVALTSVPVSELYYKQRNGNVTPVSGINYQQMRANLAVALVDIWAYADSVMGRSRVQHVADMWIGVPGTLTDMQAVTGFNSAVDIVTGNAYVNIFDASVVNKTDQQMIDQAIANFDETVVDGPAWWIVQHIADLNAQSPNAIFGTYEGDEGSDHFYGPYPPGYFDFTRTWKKRATGGGAFAQWYWQKLADLGVKWHTHFHDAGNWSENRVAGIRENPADTVLNNDYFNQFRIAVDAGGVNKTP
jgi:hypothetical protein